MSLMPLTLLWSCYTSDYSAGGKEIRRDNLHIMMSISPTYADSHSKG